MTVTLSDEQYNALLASEQTAVATLDAANLRADDEQARAEAEAREARLRDYLTHCRQMGLYGKLLTQRDVDEISDLLADPTGQRVAEPEYSVEVWGMTDGAPDEWVLVKRGEGVMEHYNTRRDAETALTAVEQARQR